MYNNSTPMTTVFINTIRFTPSKQQGERSEAGTGITLILQTHAVSFYLVRWVQRFKWPQVIGIAGPQRNYCTKHNSLRLYFNLSSIL